ncbi:hypothetical protein B0O80DRAFT_454986 [Mortierella sp. GBAus27b]|nr:hypothetical protein B0O80DRAFT_454986 [Mortierella sp. GBAus27b]
MPRSSPLAVILSIPLILDEIASSLTPCDLAQCLRVCSSWNAAFAPLLWNRILLTNQQIITLFHTSPDVQRGLARNADHVRSIHSVFCYVFQSFPKDKAFRNLVRLDTLASELHNKGIVDHTNTQHLLKFVKVNTGLRQIILSNFPLGSVPTSRMLGDTVASHPSLVSLTVNCFRDAHLTSIQHVLRGAALANIEKLSLTCRSRITWDSKDTDILGGAIVSPNQPDLEPYQLVPPANVATRLKDLTLDANVEQCIHVTLVPLLRHCPNLERLFVPCMDTNKSMRDLCQVLEECCPKLQHLEGGDYRATDEHQAMLLNACQHLKTFNMESAQPMGLRSIDALLHPRHSATLEKLSLRNCTAISSRHLQLILTSCPSLRSFDALSSLSGSDGFEPRIDIQDVPIRSDPAWACKGLYELHIGFTGFSTLPTDQPLEPYIRAIYLQLAALTELETLYLAGEMSAAASIPHTSRAWGFDFTLESGMGELATLQRLRTLNIQKLKHHRIGSEEAQWMMVHWPNLKNFHGPPDAANPEGGGGGGGGGSFFRHVYPAKYGRGRDSIRSVVAHSVGFGGSSSSNSCPSQGSGYLHELIRYNPTLKVTISV